MSKKTYNEAAIPRIFMDKTNRGMRGVASLPEAARERRGRGLMPRACAEN